MLPVIHTWDKANHVVVHSSPRHLGTETKVIDDQELGPNSHILGDFMITFPERHSFHYGDIKCFQ